MRPGQVAQRQRIGRHVHAHGLHHNHGSQGQALRSVEHGRRKGLVIVDERANALLVEKVFNHRQRVEVSGNGTARITAQQMHSAFGFQGALNQQFVAGEYFQPFAG